MERKIREGFLALCGCLVMLVTQDPPTLAQQSCCRILLTLTCRLLPQLPVFHMAGLGQSWQVSLEFRNSSSYLLGDWVSKEFGHWRWTIWPPLFEWSVRWPLGELLSASCDAPSRGLASPQRGLVFFWHRRAGVPETGSSQSPGKPTGLMCQGHMVQHTHCLRPRNGTAPCFD